MRLWHTQLIPVLPVQQLLGQHRECCALRGLGWGRPHATVNYVFECHPAQLVAYHLLILDEMRRRGYSPDWLWRDPNYRGKLCPSGWPAALLQRPLCRGRGPYPQHHTPEYLEECVANLKSKGIHIIVPDEEL